jgi:hypothetical protein
VTVCARLCVCVCLFGGGRCPLRASTVRSNHPPNPKSHYGSRRR